MSNGGYGYPVSYPAALTRSPSTRLDEQRYTFTNVPSTINRGDDALFFQSFPEGASSIVPGGSNSTGRPPASQEISNMNGEVFRVVPSNAPIAATRYNDHQLHDNAGQAASYLSRPELSLQQDVGYPVTFVPQVHVRVAGEGYVNGHIQRPSLTPQGHGQALAMTDTSASLRSLGAQTQSRPRGGPAPQHYYPNTRIVSSTTHTPNKTQTYIKNVNATTISNAENRTPPLPNSIRKSRPQASLSNSQIPHYMMEQGTTFPANPISVHGQTIGAGGGYNSEQRSSMSVPAWPLTNTNPQSDNMAFLSGAPVMMEKSGPLRSRQQSKIQSDEPGTASLSMNISSRGSDPKMTGWNAFPETSEQLEEPSSRPSSGPTTVDPRQLYKMPRGHQNKTEATSLSDPRQVLQKDKNEELVVPQKRTGQAPEIEIPNDIREENETLNSETANILIINNQNPPRTDRGIPDARRVSEGEKDSGGTNIEDDIRAMAQKLGEHARDPKVFQQIWESMGRSIMNLNQSHPLSSEQGFGNKSPVDSAPALRKQAPLQYERGTAPNRPMYKKMNVTLNIESQTTTGAPSLEQNKRQLTLDAAAPRNQPAPVFNPIQGQRNAKPDFSGQHSALVLPQTQLAKRIVQRPSINSRQANYPAAAQDVSPPQNSMESSMQEPMQQLQRPMSQSMQSITTNGALRPQLPASAIGSDNNATYQFPPKPLSVWPEDKRDFIAIAAARILNNMPENRNVSVSPLQLRGFLDLNPDYHELCDVIEGLGLKVNRPTFAKTLWSEIAEAFPRFGQPKPKLARGQQSKARTKTTKTVAHRPQHEQTITNGTQSPMAGSSHTPPISRRAVSDQARWDTGAAAVEGQNTYPLSRSGQAFSPAIAGKGRGPARDISSSHAINTPPIAKAPQALTKEMAARRRTFTEIIDLTTDDDGPGRRENYGTAQQQATPSMDATTSLDSKPTAKITSSTSENAPPRSVIPKALATLLDGKVKPIDNSLVLSKPRYNPITIARDVLIASGRHPSQRPLNVHLEILRKRFPGVVTDFSDLSTIPWDILDPGGLPVGSENMDREEKSSTKSPEQQLSTKPSQQEYLHNPVSEKLPAKPAIKPLSVTNGSQEPSLSERNSILEPTRDSPSILGSEGSSKPGLSAKSPFPSSVSRPTDVSDQQSMEILKFSTSSAGRGRGRPRKSTSTPTHQPGTPADLIGEKADILSHVEQRMGMGPPEQPLKRKAVRSHKTSPETEPNAKRQKPDKVESPKSIPFICEWEKCKAELQNLDTLRRHILTVHNKVQSSGVIECRWGKCVDPQGMTNAPEFAAFEEFKLHMENNHLVPLSWYLGDGPRATNLDGDDFDDTQYLRDSSGREITPSVISQLVERGSAKANNAKRLALEKQKYDPALESPELFVPRGAYPMGTTSWEFIDRPTDKRPYTFGKNSKKEKVRTPAKKQV